MNNDWSDHEVELIVADYFAMLVDELNGKPVNKTQQRNSLIPLLNGRSAKSVEFKHRNISAMLIEMGKPFISGYKPLPNAQRSKLVPIIRYYLRSHPYIEELFLAFTMQSAVARPDQISFDKWIVPAPSMREGTIRERSSRSPIKINYLELEQRNKDLGSKGEELVLTYERSNLVASGNDKLAEQVEWVSRDLGDGAGFDICSKNLDGTDKYIEVKTTKLGKETPFFFSENENLFSIENEKNYFLYRVFDFARDPKMFFLNGRFDSFCKMEATQYRGLF